MSSGPEASTSQPGRLSRMRTWLARPKLWDDVFTRTVATLLSAAILGALAVAAGYVHLTARAVAVLLFIVIGAAVLVFQLFFEAALSAIGGSRKGSMFYFHLFYQALLLIGLLTWLGFHIFG